MSPARQPLHLDVGDVCAVFTDAFKPVASGTVVDTTAEGARFDSDEFVAWSTLEAEDVVVIVPPEALALTSREVRILGSTIVVTTEATGIYALKPVATGHALAMAAVSAVPDVPVATVASAAAHPTAPIITKFLAAALVELYSSS
jgi:hypothetical protein